MCFGHPHVTINTFFLQKTFTLLKQHPGKAFSPKEKGHNASHYPKEPEQLEFFFSYPSTAKTFKIFNLS
jgi:hypothetical protein